MHALSIMSVAFCCTGGENIAEHRSKGKGHQRQNYLLDAGLEIYTYTKAGGGMNESKICSLRALLCWCGVYVCV